MGLRWPSPGVSLDDGDELIAPTQGTPLGVRADPGCVEGSRRLTAGAGLLLYTDGLTEARHDGELFGLDRVSAVLVAFIPTRSPSYALAPPTSPMAP